MLDKCKDERGYLLIESLLGLILLSVIAMSLITVLPTLMDASARLDKEQAIYHRLFELHDREIEGPQRITEPYEFHAFRRRNGWCAIYVWRDTICYTLILFQKNNLNVSVFVDNDFVDNRAPNLTFFGFGCHVINIFKTLVHNVIDCNRMNFSWTLF